MREEVIGGWRLAEGNDWLRLDPTPLLPRWPGSAGGASLAAVLLAGIAGGQVLFGGPPALAAAGMLGVSAFVGLILSNDRSARRPGRAAPVALDRAAGLLLVRGRAICRLADVRVVWVRPVFGTGRAADTLLGHEVRVQTGPADTDEIALPLPRMGRKPAEALARRVREFVLAEAPTC